MKLFFLRSDSLYTIFTTIEKVETSKPIEIFIENGNQFFLNERRATQIKELLEEKKIQATFIVNNTNKKIFLEKIGLHVSLKSQPKIKKALILLYNFFFNIKYVHLYIYQKKHYITYIIFAIELIIIAVIFYFLYSLILPSTTITVYPFYQNEPVVYNFRYIPQNYDESNFFPTSHIKIPYYTQTLSYSETINITNTDIKYLSSPAQGSVRIVNKTDEEISLLKDTELVTEDGLVFYLTQGTYIPAQSENSAGFTNAIARASTYDQNGNVIGEKGTLKKGERLYIKKLAQSLYQKNIYVEVTKNFKKIPENKFVSAEDKQELSQRLKDSVTNKKLVIANEHRNDTNNILLPFNETIHINIEEYEFAKTKQKSGYLIQGTIHSKIIYSYTTPENIVNAVQEYLQERSSSTDNIVTINTDNISFLSYKTGENNSIIIPTKINVIQSYNFLSDSNGIKGQIKDIILEEKNMDRIKQQLINFTEIANITIQNKPFRSNNVATTKSRIFLEIVNP